MPKDILVCPLPLCPPYTHASAQRCGGSRGGSYANSGGGDDYGGGGGPHIDADDIPF